MNEMISVSVATSIIAEQSMSFGVEQVALSDAIGRVLAEDWRADRDMPPFDRVAMDGIAILYAEFAAGSRTYNVEAVAAAGDPQRTLQDQSNCLEVMTGGVLPHGCDTVVRYEDVSVDDGEAKVNIDAIKQGQNIHRRGVDHISDELIVRAGMRLSTAEIGIAATLGKTHITVQKLPKVLVISTGNELVPINQTPEAHQIRRSNVHQIISVLHQYGISADHEHLSDDREEITQRLAEILDQYDAILMSGGVSKGKFDYLPEVLKELEVERLFHRIKQRPGKPFWFGQYNQRCCVFAFPGNPISTYLCVHKYFLHWLGACHQVAYNQHVYAELAEDVHFKPLLTYFQQVSLMSHSDGRLLASPSQSNGSGDLASITRADAFMEFPEDKVSFKAGESYPVIRFR